MEFILDPLPPKGDLETKAVLKKAVAAHRFLAELKGVSGTIPKQGILINTLTLQEAKDSSAIENIITTHDEVYQEALFPDLVRNPAAKEVKNYESALKKGYDLVSAHGVLTDNFILRDLKVGRVTATKYLEELTAAGFLGKRKMGRSNFYINEALFRILTRED